ncbi:alkylation response protein AidB-like acyl-CoA dehydrogenase [Rhodanobacter sp. ANJX3]|uniref:acyl-CoA dehydrogenase n=1 Tax=Rhodanobacter sp. ANJX3 TaxID=2723083 RepID=UPI00161E1A21|nr:acyl-CoA dehydrogenase [Rhodanobacter sp. ANJX3]MBB5357060.1 alkylation response protein AidB-like acyl-CoA dehydrogenase [Rhodanobacter sp. ANJX3]
MTSAATRTTRPLTKSVLEQLRKVREELSLSARTDDLAETFPAASMEILKKAGCLKSVLPFAYGGVSAGWHAESVDLLFNLLRTIGGLHLSCARLFEGHVNAFQLLWTFGNAAQRDSVCRYVSDGGLLGVWNAPSREGELLLCEEEGLGLMLKGPKAYASGAGGIQRPLVTARHPQKGLVIVWPDIVYKVGDASEWSMHGMRASVTRSVKFDGIIKSSHVFGKADDYHSQPQFSGGSWRFLAAQLGAGEALVELMRLELVRRGRTTDSHQRARMAHCVTALETGRKWILDTAYLASAKRPSVEKVIQHANAARVVVERSLLDVMEIVQRGIGLQLLSRDHPGERILRDLTTYLRQPAPDALLEFLGEHAFAKGIATLSGSGDDAEV